MIPSDVKVVVKAKLVGSAIVVLLQRNGEPDQWGAGAGLGWGSRGGCPPEEVRHCVGGKKNKT